MKALYYGDNLQVLRDSIATERHKLDVRQLTCGELGTTEVRRGLL